MVDSIQELFTQSAKPFFDTFSDLGTGAPFVMILLSMFLLFGTKVGLRAGLIYSTASYCTFVLKWIIAAPRPYFVDPGIAAHSLSSGYGMPSGHAAQNSAGLWPSIIHNRRNLLAGLLVLFVLTVALSRIYLGVHYPAQVLAGLALGTCLFAITLMIEAPVIGFLKSKTLPVQSILILAPFILLFLLDRGWIVTTPIEIPPEWQTGYDRAIEARAVQLGIDPSSAEVVSRKQDFSLIEPRSSEFYAALLGWMVVALVALRRGVYEVTGWRHALANLVIGGLIVGGLFGVSFGLLDIALVQLALIAGAPLICAYIVPFIVARWLTSEQTNMPDRSS